MTENCGVEKARFPQGEAVPGAGAADKAELKEVSQQGRAPWREEAFPESRAAAPFFGFSGPRKKYLIFERRAAIIYA